MRTIFLLLLLSVVTLAFVHISALQFYLYWQYVWLDVPVHFLGGAVVTFLFFSLVDLGVRLPTWCQKVVPVLIMVFLVGVAWELYELLIGIVMRDNYVFDTTLDLVMDVCGGYVGFIISRRARMQDML